MNDYKKNLARKERNIDRILLRILGLFETYEIIEGEAAKKIKPSRYELLVKHCGILMAEIQNYEACVEPAKQKDDDRETPD